MGKWYEVSEVSAGTRDVIYEMLGAIRGRVERKAVPMPVQQKEMLWA
jgi:hypothetical protein